MRAALYLRVSSDKQTTVNQLPELQRYIDFHRWTASGTYIDEDVSGKRTSRPAFDRMMQDARLGKFDVVLVVRLDRLGRSVKHLLSTLEELNKLGIGFASVTQSIDTTTAAGKLIFTIIGAFAEFESSLISERTKAGLARVREAGTKLGARPSIDRERLHTLRNQGQTQASIAKILGCSERSIQRIERAA